MTEVAAIPSTVESSSDDLSGYVVSTANEENHATQTVLIKVIATHPTEPTRVLYKEERELNIFLTQKGREDYIWKMIQIVHASKINHPRITFAASSFPFDIPEAFQSYSDEEIAEFKRLYREHERESDNLNIAITHTVESADLSGYEVTIEHEENFATQIVLVKIVAIHPTKPTRILWELKTELGIFLRPRGITDFSWNMIQVFHSLYSMYKNFKLKPQPFLV
jgi:hypothetical protein